MRDYEKIRMNQELNPLDIETKLSTPLRFHGIDEYGGLLYKYYKSTKVLILFS
jgi:hypothetical protein